MAASRALKIFPHVKEIRIHLCQKSDASKGVRDFIERNYVDLKKNNPKMPILVRECSGILPKIYARHEKGVEYSAPLADLPSEKIMLTLESLVQKK